MIALAFEGERRHGDQNSQRHLRGHVVDRPSRDDEVKKDGQWVDVSVPEFRDTVRCVRDRRSATSA